jgi:hypothetical protein
MQRTGLRAVCALVISVLAATVAVIAPLTASAASYGPGSLVSEIPVNGTPHVLDGRVNSIAQVGNTIILGGQFTQTRNNSSETVIARSNLVAFDATTKEISTTFAPNPNGTVNVLLPTGDGEIVFVGGWLDRPPLLQRQRILLSPAGAGRRYDNKRHPRHLHAERQPLHRVIQRHLRPPQLRRNDVWHTGRGRHCQRTHAVHQLDHRRRVDDRALLRLRAHLLHAERPVIALLPVLHARERRGWRAAPYRELGIDFTQVRGMFLADDKLYWSLTSGELRRIDWVQGVQSGKPVAGTNAVVSGPALDGINWGSPRALFLFQDRDGDGPPATPVAAFSSDCLSLECTFDTSA